MVGSKVCIFTLLFGYVGAIIRVPIEIRNIQNQQSLSRSKRQTSTSLINNEPYSVAQIQIGTPPQTFTVALDTGSGDLFIPSVQCTTSSCTSEHRFDCSKSTTCQTSTTAFSSGFGDPGTLAYDIVCFGTTNQICTTNRQAIGLISTTSSSSGALYDMSIDGLDGILGLSYDWLKANKPTAVMTQIFQSSKCPQKLFAFWLNSTLTVQSGERHGGEFTVCGTDSSHYTGSITYVPVITTAGYWTISMDSFTVGSYSFNGPFQTVVDSGAPNGFGIPANMYASVMAQFGANSTGQLPCSKVASLPIVTIKLNGVSFTLDPSIYVNPYLTNQITCSLGLANSGTQLWLLGVMFQRKYYSIFDYGNSRIGFARSLPTIGAECQDGATCSGYAQCCRDPTNNADYCCGLSSTCTPQKTSNGCSDGTPVSSGGSIATCQDGAFCSGNARCCHDSTSNVDYCCGASSSCTPQKTSNGCSDGTPVSSGKK